MCVWFVCGVCVCVFACRPCPSVLLAGDARCLPTRQVDDLRAEVASLKEQLAAKDAEIAALKAGGAAAAPAPEPAPADDDDEPAE